MPTDSFASYASEITAGFLPPEDSKVPDFLTRPFSARPFKINKTVGMLRFNACAMSCFVALSFEYKKFIILFLFVFLTSKLFMAYHSPLKLLS